MPRRNKPKHGSIFLSKPNKSGVRRYYYNVTLPGTSKRKAYPLRQPGQAKATTDKRMAIALADTLYERAEKQAENDSSGYDGSVPSLAKLFLASHEKSIAAKGKINQKKEVSYYRSALNDLIEFLNDPDYIFTLSVGDLRPNRILLYREYLSQEKGVCRNTINKKVNVVKQMVSFAVQREWEPATVLYELVSVKTVKRGEKGFFDHPKVGPIEWEVVLKIFPYLSQTIRDMLTIMRYTGARPGEIRIMRPCDIDRSDLNSWLYRPTHHKTSRFGHDRTIAIGGQAQLVLTKYLLRSKTDYCFPPCDNSRGDMHDCYTTASFARAVSRAVRRYNADHKKNKISFHAHQLRHTFGTEVCKKYGRSAAKHVLGHESDSMTDRYVEDALKIAALNDAKMVAKKIG